MKQKNRRFPGRSLTKLLQPLLITYLLLGSSQVFPGKTQEKQEAEALAKSFQKTISKLFDGDFLDQDTLLPEKDKGKKFHPPDTNSSQISLCPFEKEILGALDKAKTTPPIDPDGAFLRKALKPNTTEPLLGLKETQKTQSPHPPKIETCTEAVSRTLSVEQRKKTETIPAQVEHYTACRGHEQKESFFWKKKAQKKEKKWKRFLEKDRTLKNFSLELLKGGIFKDYGMIKKWAHKDNTPHCHHFETKTRMISASQTIISWDPISPALAAFLQNAPHCSQIGSSSPSLDRKTLVFRCEDNNNGACKRIRERGGQIIQKTCIKEDPLGECVTYQKTYEIPQGRSFIEASYLFDKKEDEIWGLNELQTESLPDTDFGETISKLYAISDISSPYKGNSPLEVEIFPGEIRRCKRSFLNGVWHDCCAKTSKSQDLDKKGIGRHLKLATCSEEEKRLFKERQEKKCIFIGQRSLKIGLEKERTYVCFPSVLSRIIQEEGRFQIGKDWGDADNPKPEGLSLNDVQRINFDTVDFSDFITNLKGKIDSDSLKTLLKERVSSFDNQSIETQTKNLLKGQIKKCQEN